MAWKPLNWKELEAWVAVTLPELAGMSVDRIIVPERGRHPNGFLKGEWAIRLTRGKVERALFVDLRPRHPAVVLCPDKGPRASVQATHSPFDLALAKHLRSRTLLALEALPRERALLIWFSGPRDGRIGLALLLIPAAPEAFLLEGAGSAEAGWPILARSRSLEDDGAGARPRFLPPDGAGAPADPPVRGELIADPWSAHHERERSILEAHFVERRERAERVHRENLKTARESLRQAEATLREVSHEPDWARYGDLLKSALAEPPPIVGGKRAVYDFVSSSYVEVPCDARLKASEQVADFYRRAKRNARKREEAEGRKAAARVEASRLEEAQALRPAGVDWEALGAYEESAGMAPARATSVPGASGASGREARGAWKGRQFESKEGLLILVGRNSRENLELTFKRARGNDLWMHVRGKPGAHVLIPLTTGKTASLETLLDAAALAIHFSDGADWGKTEVDYTHKKYVKRIRDSTEASYTGNKTLIAEPDSERLRRLLGRR